MVFKSVRLEKKFQRKGYVVLPLLSSQQVLELLLFFKKEYNIDFSGFHSTHFLNDEQLKRTVHNKISSILEPQLQKYLLDYNAVFANFMVKSIGKDSRMPLHADWTYVDENKFQSLGVWSPLINTNKENGRLGVVPKSHLLKKNYRGPNIPSPFHDFNEYIIKNYGKLLKMKAGEVLIYDHRLLHFSPANLSKSIRPAMNLVLAPQSASLYHYTNVSCFPAIEKYKVDNPEFYINYVHLGQPDKTCLHETISVNWSPYTQGYIDANLKTRAWKRMLSFIYG